jgi:RND family efflux transporter MFP subunit
LQEGEELYAIDSKLIELDLQVNKAEIDRAQAQLDEDRRKWTEGQQLAADQLIPTTELASLESAVHMQQAELERLKARQARNQELLVRHIVRTPFNAIVLDEAIEIGQRVQPGDTTVTLVGTDEFWVQASLPTDQLRWVQLPSADRAGAGAVVLLDPGNGQSTRFEGEVLQRLGDLTEVGRMARILIRIQDPLRLGATGHNAPLLLGSYVRVEIDAGELKNVLALDRAALREGDRIWVADPEGRLQIRPVVVRWRKDETVYIDDAMQPGEVLIVSNLRVALPGMAVQPQSVEATAIGSPGVARSQP